MEDKRVDALLQYVAGMTICQSFLIQTFIDKGLIDKAEILSEFDIFIGNLNTFNPEQPMVWALEKVRDILKGNQHGPHPPENQQGKPKRPDWMRGIIDGNSQ